METASILQVIPGFKPDVDGMGDFSRRLGTALWEKHSIRSHYVVFRKPHLPLDAGEIAPNTISYPSAATPALLLNHIEDLKKTRNFDAILVHYGPYSYSPLGRPKAFGKILDTLSKSSNLGIFFHELYASGKPWKRAFWTNREQKRCVVGLLRYATIAFTSNSEYMQKLENLNTTASQIVKIPVVSNIGEPLLLPSLSERMRQLIIFGQIANRTRLYKEHKETLETICRLLNIHTVIDVGSGSSTLIPSRLDRAVVRSVGWMDDQQLSILLSESIAGAIGYWPDVWEKSGVIAAYQAHGMIPVLIPLESRRTQIPSFVPYVVVEDLLKVATKDGSIPIEQMQSISDASHDYYLRNQSVYRCAEVIASSFINRHAHMENSRSLLDQQ
jgi:hypothetical protein